MKGSHTAIHDPWTPAAVEPEKMYLVFVLIRCFNKKYSKDNPPL